MKTIGLIGGMSWESSAIYYQLINQHTKEKLGGNHSAKSLMFSVDFNEIEKLQHTGQWEKLTAVMIDAASKLEKAGADFVVICTNTMHKMAPDIEAHLSIPLLHIADATAKAIHQQGLKKIALLGTNFTMSEDFYKGRLKEKHQLEVLTPNEADRMTVHNIIYNELVYGNFREESRQKYKTIIQKLQQAGAEGVILGCTEIPLLIKQKDSPIPVFDTTAIHALEAVNFALS